MTDFFPTSEAEAAAFISDCAAAGKTIRILGGGTRARLARDIAADAQLSTQNLTGVTLYEPAEMVISARSGTPVREVLALIDQHNQMLPFEPLDHRTLLATTGEPTMGGLAATNASGPRRIYAGAARDHLIGARFVNGRGEIVKSGGRVMKNVTGLDLVKVHCGAYGTLGLLTEVTFKLRPKPERVATLIYKRLDEASAIRLLGEALGSPFEITGAAYLPIGHGRDFSRALLRIEGFDASVSYRIDELRRRFAAYATPREALEGPDADRLWRAVRDVEFLSAPAEAPLWRLSVKPSDAAACVAHLRAIDGARYFYDLGGGLIWFTDPSGQNAALIRDTLAAMNGHATLVRGPDALRQAVPPFSPLPAAQEKLMRSVKHAFDPQRLINPDLMYPGL
ncbi:FAD-binding protein [Methylovirgula sp. 4M-Z18]|uniref:FAD-binding protein n=1 Tax=Methylovirgula sp. 4M-Z18 TaxID=2293567 RepID=UPI000E2E99DC|nr:FAD-binding protein [Methylovirgula sp. 4M-Z18]RFB79703.1 FAD-binding protein [Methylovirgula sp. 4M-Z18]